MKRITRAIIMMAFGLIYWGKTNGQTQNTGKAHVIDSLLEACYEQDLFNGVALVANEGRILVYKGYGVSDLEKQEPLKLTDRFYIGSLTKQFTSVLILKLREAGLIDIYQPISVYLEEFSQEDWMGITIHQLLTHTSGLRSYTGHPKFDKSVKYSDREMFEMIKEPLLFEPGTDWNYSNSGYFLLGKIAERITQKDYGTLLKEEIFSPLNMSNSGFSEKWLDESLAKGYTRTINGFQPMPKYSPATLLSTGGIYATAGDLFIWTQALDGNKLLSDASKRILFHPIKNDYACGLYVKRGVDKDGHQFERYFHGGMIQGYHSFILKRVPQKQTVILLDNFYNTEIQTIKNRIWSALIEEDLEDIKPKLSVLLFEACSNQTLTGLIDSISNHTALFEEKFIIKEFDVNMVAYRLMDANRFSEARELFQFNSQQYPNSWNVYDSLGELELKQGNFDVAEKYYRQSLERNPESLSAKKALEEIGQRQKNK